MENVNNVRLQNNSKNELSKGKDRKSDKLGTGPRYT